MFFIITMLLTPAQIKPESFESRRNSLRREKIAGIDGTEPCFVAQFRPGDHHGVIDMVL